MDHGDETFVCLVVSRCDSAVLFEIAEEVLDEMSPAIHGEVAGYGTLAVGLRWDHRGGSAVVELLAEPVIVEAFVSDQRADLDPGDQGSDALTIMALAGQQNETGEIAEAIDQGDDLAR